mmetsp:Transcript_41761/g.99063  ORF Transcript_41761/g.99063 Transcript_41761/m.99063 type:complete len:237 (+) Transcript_41761:257-967(+)
MWTISLLLKTFGLAPSISGTALNAIEFQSLCGATPGERRARSESFTRTCASSSCCTPPCPLSRALEASCSASLSSWYLNRNSSQPRPEGSAPTERSEGLFRANSVPPARTESAICLSPGISATSVVPSSRAASARSTNGLAARLARRPSWARRNHDRAAPTLPSQSAPMATVRQTPVASPPSCCPWYSQRDITFLAIRRSPLSLLTGSRSTKRRSASSPCEGHQERYLAASSHDDG